MAPKNNVNRYVDTHIQRQTSPFDALYNHPIVSWIRDVQNSLRRGYIHLTTFIEILCNIILI